MWCDLIASDCKRKFLCLSLCTPKVFFLSRRIVAYTSKKGLKAQRHRRLRRRCLNFRGRGSSGLVYNDGLQCWQPPSWASTMFAVMVKHSKSDSIMLEGGGSSSHPQPPMKRTTITSGRELKSAMKIVVSSAPHHIQLQGQRQHVVTGAKSQRLWVMDSFVIFARCSNYILIILTQ
jgi:hypothetical protein